MYELIDTGNEEKLERFGDVIFARPDPQALWPKNKPELWKTADATYTRDQKEGKWIYKNKIPESWNIEHGGISFIIKPTAFKHTGLFPEHASNWEWLRKVAPQGGEVLNLFGYTGGATLACAQAGAKVVHVDGSKSAVTWARENAELSKLADKPIRWIVEDVRVFVEREIKRGRKYDGIIMDPPSFGHGANKELWKIEEDFLPLIENCKKLLSDNPSFFLINGYAAGYSPIAYENNLLDLVEKYGGKIEKGELTIQEKDGGRLLPCGIFARWKK